MKAFRIYFSLMCLLSAFAFVGTSCGDDDEKGLQQFTVTFDSQGGSSVASQTVNEGEKLTQPVAPTKGNSAFTGWYKEAACVSSWNFDRDVVTSDMTLYAGWREADYIVTFETNGGSAIEPQGVLEGGLVSKPVAPTKEGMAFEGWYTDAELTELYDFSTPVTSDLTLYAKWTAINLEALEQLVDEASQLRSENYEPESFNAMQEVLTEVQQLLYRGGLTSQEIVDSYQALSEALQNLVEKPYRATVSLSLSPEPEDGFISVTPGNWFYLHAAGLAADGEPSTHSEVTFECELDDWAEQGTEVVIDDNSLTFQAASTLSVGQTKRIRIQTAENPDIYAEFELKVVSASSLVTQFIDLVNSLPAKENINMDSYEEVARKIKQAESLYYQCSSLPSEEKGPEFEEAYRKLNEYWDAIGAYMMFNYSFDGNRCKLTEAIYGESVYCTYEPNGTFPAGTYTVDLWEDWGDGEYAQTRFVLESNGKFYMEYRFSSSSTGSNPGAWERDEEGDYRITGDKENGGTILMYITNYDDEDDVVVPPSGRKRLFASFPATGK